MVQGFRDPGAVWHSEDVRPSIDRQGPPFIDASPLFLKRGP